MLRYLHYKWPWAKERHSEEGAAFLTLDMNYLLLQLNLFSQRFGMMAATLIRDVFSSRQSKGVPCG